MAYIPITDAEIAAQKPLKSDILARLRDNPQQVLCDPPGSTTLKLRPSAFVLEDNRAFDYTAGVIIPISRTDNKGEISLYQLDVYFNSVAAVAPSQCYWSTCLCWLGLNAIPRYVGGVIASVRINRHAPPVSWSGARSGLLETQAWLDLPLTNTWVTVFQWTVGGQSPTIQLRANLVGNIVTVQAQKINAYSGRVFPGWTGYRYNLQYKNA